MDNEITKDLKTEMMVTPLVSIVIITYNSAKYIIETLESSKKQSYKNVELILSDDFSSDNTLDVCEQWLIENQKAFVSTKIIRAAKNTGIPGNCNRGINAARGHWVKLIAGDDLLLPECIEENIDFIKKNTEAKIVISNLVVFLDETSPKKILRISKPLKPLLWSSLSSSREQYDALLLNFCGSTPTFFISKDVYLKVSYDEQFPFIEDYPFVLNATKFGFKILYHDKETVMYRKRNNSVYYGSEKKLFGDFYEKTLKFDTIYRYPFLSPKRRKFEIFEYNRKRLLNRVGLNRNNFPCKVVNIISAYFNPY